MRNDQLSKAISRIRKFSGSQDGLDKIDFWQMKLLNDGLEKIFLRNWSGFDSVANFSSNQKDYIKLSFEFNKDAIKNITQEKGFKFTDNPIYEIDILRSGPTSYYLKEKLYTKSENKKDFIYLEMNNSKGIISTREKGKINRQYYPQKNQPMSFKSTELVLRQISDPDRFYPLFTLKRALEEVSAYYYFDTAFSSSIRQPSSYSTETKLLPDGQNLVTILNTMKNNYSHQYDQVEEAIKKINPYFKDINFSFIGSKLYLVLREINLEKSVSIEHISDGTVRYLLLLSVLLNPEQGSLICLDEPEISLHPDMINTISEAIKQASRNQTQLIIATHSPLLLNSFEIEDVLVFEKNTSNETEVHIKSSEDFEEWIDDFLVGQAWLQGLIGGKRW